MDKWLKPAVNAITWVAGAGASVMFGGWTELLALLALLMIVDILTGWTASALEGKRGKKGGGLRSRTGQAGLARKVLVWLLIALSHRADLWLNSADLINHLGGIVKLPAGVHPLRDGTALFYALNEFLSLTENAGRIGLPMPKWVKGIVAVLRDKTGEAA